MTSMKHTDKTCRECKYCKEYWHGMERGGVMKVYVVQSGEYSDRGIECIFSTREKAELYVETYNSCTKWNEADIEEYELDSVFLDDGRMAFSAEKSRSGKWLVMPCPYEYAKTRYPIINKTNAIIFVYAKDADHALKIAQDIYAEEMAKKEGVKL